MQHRLSASFFALLPFALLKAVQGTNSPAAGDNYGGPETYPDGRKPEYVKARSELDPGFVDWKYAVCDKPQAGRVYDRYICCFIPKVGINYKVVIDSDGDDTCITASDKNGIFVSWTIAPGDQAQESATAVSYLSRQVPRGDDISQNIIFQSSPFCLVDPPVRYNLGNGAELFKSDSTWSTKIVPLPKATEKDFPPALAQSPATDADILNFGGPWYSYDCNALADKIRNNKTAYPPKNRFALKALGAK